MENTHTHLTPTKDNLTISANQIQEIFKGKQIRVNPVNMNQAIQFNKMSDKMRQNKEKRK